jgi:hypothetical protein
VTTTRARPRARAGSPRRPPPRTRREAARKRTRSARRRRRDGCARRGSCHRAEDAIGPTTTVPLSLQLQRRRLPRGTSRTNRRGPRSSRARPRG